MTKYKATNRSRAWIETALLATGLVGVGLWLGSVVVPGIWQSWDNWVFDSRVSGRPTAVTAYVGEEQRQIGRSVSKWLGLSVPPEAKPTTLPNRPAPSLLANQALIGRLTIPRLHLHTIVREGTGEDTLLVAVGHIRGTALPGGNGNVAVAGHRDTLFSGLAGIQKNDLIKFETLRGQYKYTVASINIVTPKDVGVLRAGPYSELTLVTCYPFDYLGSAPYRFVVKARQVSEDLQRDDLAAASDLNNEKKIALIATARRTNRVGAHTGGTFSLSKRHSQQLAPGISIGVDDFDADTRLVSGWLWIMPDRHTVWLKHQSPRQPVRFTQSGEERELVITGVTRWSVTGYLRDPLSRQTYLVRNPTPQSGVRNSANPE